MQTTQKSRSPASVTTFRPDSRDEDSTLWMRRTGRGLIAILSLFLLFDGIARAVSFAPYVEGTVQSGYPASYGVGIGLALAAATVLYLIPRTAILGAILLTGYLGAAVATNLRLQVSFLFPLLFGVLVWTALYLVDVRVRNLIPLRR